MTDEADPGGAPVSAEWRAEMQRRRRAYEDKRTRWVSAWREGGRPEPPTDDDDGKPRRGRTIHDKRQFRLDF